MTAGHLQTTRFLAGRVAGASPAESSYYVLVLFDIADAKKYRLLMRILKRYARRIQKSVFEAQLKPKQIREMTDAIEKLMRSERFFDPDDNVRVYRIASNCDVTVFGNCTMAGVESDIFI